ncbi:J domain-containing protein [Vibrio alfacsensis]|uniref:J domain-containing protein n=1 Tax=Vibrio alfacsensis TaxID=1074311 RepID=UPI004068DCC1
MSFRITTLIFASSVCLSSLALAFQSPTQPEAQFDLAQQLALKPNSDSPFDVRYWLEQSAYHGYIPAQKQLAKDYGHGLTGEIDYSQAIYWFTSVALNDPTDSGFLLADFVQRHQAEVSKADLVESWYQLAALKNPQAEEAYNQFLEERFNQLRAKQLSEIVDLDKKAIAQEEQENMTFTTQQKAESSSVWYAVGAFGLALLIGGGAFGYRWHRKRAHIQSDHEITQSQQLENQVNELQFANKQLKRQFEKVFKEFKKIKEQTDNQKLAVACAMFGYTPYSIPDSKAVKLRYRQLSKLYHPDSRGSEEEMKRLNLAFKTISQNVTKG